MHISDFVQACVRLLETPSELLGEQRTYNFHSMSFTPARLLSEIHKHRSRLHVEYRPDFRQQIAAEWPRRLDDTTAREKLGFAPEFDFESMVVDMMDRARGAPQARVQ